MPPTPQTAQEVASDQHGAITLGQLRACGISRRRLERWLLDGTLQQHRRGVYRFRGAPLTWEAAVTVNVLVAGPNAVASRGTAARLLGLTRGAATSPIEVTVAGDQRTIRNGLIVHSTRKLAKEDLTTAAGIPCTNAARTIIDLAASLSRPQLIALVDDAICTRAVTRVALHRRALSLANGRARVDTIAKVTHPDAEGEFWSWLERTLGTHLKASDLPGASWNMAIRDEKGLIGGPPGGRLEGLIGVLNRPPCTPLSVCMSARCREKRPDGEHLLTVPGEVHGQKCTARYRTGREERLGCGRGPREATCRPCGSRSPWRASR